MVEPIVTGGFMATYVIAGGTGRVGSIVADELLSRKADTTVIVRDERSAEDWRRRGARVEIGSLDDASFLARVLHRASGFFVLLPENVAPSDFHGARRRMADAIATAVAESGVAHVVMLSAVAAVLPDGNGPAKDLHYLERKLRASGTTVTILRACYFQDNVRDMIVPARQSGIYPNFTPSADAPFPMIATMDVGRFAALALLTPPEKSEIVDLLGPPYSMREVASRLGAALGSSVDVVTVPSTDHVPALVAAGMPRELAEIIAEMFAAFAAGRIGPQGDRQLIGTTQIDTVIATYLTRVAPASP
jgi:uncharacterized protein YbjT (DUF2867 family)